MPRRISYAQNGEDVRIWHGFGPREPRIDSATPLTYVEVGANEPREMSLTAALYDLGWHGLLIEADPKLADRLRAYRPGDVVVNAAAADSRQELTFYRVPGTGLGTLDAQEADAAAARGFDVIATTVAARPLDDMIDEFLQQSPTADIHVISIDVEGAEGQVLAGLTLDRHRPWVICIEAVEPGTSTPTHAQWEHHILGRNYREAAFDGVNRWYVAAERADQRVSENAGASPGMTIAEAIAMPFNILDAGHHGWTSHESVRLHETSNRAFNRSAWQREAILHQAQQQVPATEYERQIEELRTALIDVQGSRTYTVSRQAARVAKKALWAAQRGKDALPPSVSNRLVRERHLKHVTVNMGHLTDPAFLGQAPTDSVAWAAAGTDTERPPLPPGLTTGTLTTDERTAIRAWLDANPFDSDEQLDSRMDNNDDEVGRVQAALRTRLRLGDSTTDGSGASTGTHVAFDARALQSPAFGTRGIGRFAKALLDGVRQAVPDEHITLIVDRGLHPLPSDLMGGCETATRIRPSDVPRFGALIQPSPMTHSPEPLVPLLRSDVPKTAVVFDFIPLHYPSIYLQHAAPRVEYAANLDALALYTEFIAISQVVANELTDILHAHKPAARDADVHVAWPQDVLAGGLPSRRVDPAGPIVLMTGDDARKNTFGGLAGIAAATSEEAQRDVVVVGMAGQDTRVHHWSIAAAMRPGEAHTLGRISDAELRELLESASCVVVPSFDEGLSLPVIEALRAGAPVVASDIPAHRELISSGAFSCDPASPRSIAQAVRKARGSAAVSARQSRQLAGHRHEVLEDAIAAILQRDVSVADTAGAARDASVGTSRGNRMSVGIATPWPPQRSGVADYSKAVFTELAQLADVTVYTTSGGMSNGYDGIDLRSVSEVFDDAEGVQGRHDAFIAVIGNSHYHLPFVELLDLMDATVIHHDARMVEFYMALRGQAGAQRLMTITPSGSESSASQLPVSEQLEDMRLLSNAGFWEVANRASRLIVHTPGSAPTISRQTGKQTKVFPFANYRAPEQATITDQDRADARQRLGLNDYPTGTIHVGSFGYVDLRTKLSDIVVESAAWLAHWGHSIALHLVGSASAQQQQLREQAQRAGLEHFEITGYITDEQYRDWVLAVDVGVQLRISPLLGVSGPLSDFAAYGTRAVASNGLCVDVDTPAFIHRLPDAVSPVIVAEAIEQVLNSPVDPQDLEAQRLAYLEEKSPRRYAELLLNVLEERR